MQTHIALSAVIGNGSPLTMSSQEIADLTGKRHDNVRADIEKMGRELSLTFQEKSEPSEGGRPTKVFHLDKRETLILVSGYRVDLRAKIVDRWMELESGAPSAAMLDPSDPKVMLAVFSHLQQQVAEKNGIIAIQTEQVKKLERIDGAAGSMCIRDAAKTLNVRPIDLTNLMAARRWIYKRVGNKNWVAYQDKIQIGYLEHADHLYLDEQGRERVSTRCLVTAKGLVKLAELLNEPLH